MKGHPIMATLYLTPFFSYFVTAWGLLGMFLCVLIALAAVRGGR
jgi:hypothetical protein